MSGNDFSKYKTETLLTIRGLLLQGLTEVDKAIVAGTFSTVGQKGAAPPSQSGQTTLVLLLKIQEELTGRGHSLTW